MLKWIAYEYLLEHWPWLMIFQTMSSDMSVREFRFFIKFKVFVVCYNTVEEKLTPFLYNEKKLD